MAGIPNEIIDRASQILDEKNFSSKKHKNKIKKNWENKTKENEQSYITELKNIDIDSVTPLEALTKLNELKNKLKL